jgi:hypothetical protein
MERSILLANQPANMAIQMTDRQRALVYQMELFENSEQIETKMGTFVHSRIGINADPEDENPIQSMVGLLARDKQYWPIYERYNDVRISSYANGLYWYVNTTQYDRLPCSLVLASKKVAKEWVNVLSKTTLRVVTLTKLSSIEQLGLSDCDVMIVLPNVYNTLMNMYQKFTWKRLIISDPSNISIPDMAKCSAGYYWLITTNPALLVSNKANNTNRLIKDIIGTDLDIENKYKGLILESKNFI